MKKIGFKGFAFTTKCDIVNLERKRNTDNLRPYDFGFM